MGRYELLKTLGRMMLCALIAAGAGGMGGTIALLLVPVIEGLARDGGTIGGVLLALPFTLGLAFFFGLYGAVFGMVLGFVPAFLTGALLVQLARWRLFSTAWSWILIGGAVGLALAAILPMEGVLASRSAWTAGGMAAMFAYRGLGSRVFRLPTFRASITAQR